MATSAGRKTRGGRVKSWSQHYRRAMREWALLWRKSGSEQDLRFALSMRASWRAWSGKAAR